MNEKNGQQALSWMPYKCEVLFQIQVIVACFKPFLWKPDLNLVIENQNMALTVRHVGHFVWLVVLKALCFVAVIDRWRLASVSLSTSRNLNRMRWLLSSIYLIVRPCLPFLREEPSCCVIAPLRRFVFIAWCFSHLVFVRIYIYIYQFKFVLLILFWLKEIIRWLFCLELWGFHIGNGISISKLISFKH